MAQLIILASAIGKMRVIRFSKLQQSDKMKNETEIDSVAKRASVRLVAAAAQVYPKKIDLTNTAFDSIRTAPWNKKKKRRGSFISTYWLRLAVILTKEKKKEKVCLGNAEASDAMSINMHSWRNLPTHKKKGLRIFTNPPHTCTLDHFKVVPTVFFE